MPHGDRNRAIEREAKLSRTRSVEVLRIREHTNDLKQRISPSTRPDPRTPAATGSSTARPSAGSSTRATTQQSFPTRYVAEKIIPADPFQVLDREGVGAMMRMAIERGRKTKPGLKIGISGEQGGDRSSIAFCHEVGLTSRPSTYRVPSRDWPRPKPRWRVRQRATANAG